LGSGIGRRSSEVDWEGSEVSGTEMCGILLDRGDVKGSDSVLEEVLTRCSWHIFTSGEGSGTIGNEFSGVELGPAPLISAYSSPVKLLS
jgi:hypothetical protein